MATWRTPIHRELNRRLRDAVGEKTAVQFAKLGLHTVGDVIRHTPRRYLAGTQMSDFASLRVGEEVAVVAKVQSTRIRQGARQRVESLITDGSGYLTVTLFAPKPFHATWWSSMLEPGSRGIFIGKVGVFNNSLQLTHPDFVMIDGQGQVTAKKDHVKQSMQRAVQRATLVGLYPATAKLPTWVIAETIALLLPSIRSLGDTLPPWVVDQAGVLSLPEALTEVHEPVDVTRAEQGRDRLLFDEAFGMQLAMAQRRRTLDGLEATPRPRTPGRLLSEFDNRLPFELTQGQVAVGETIFDELARPRPMHRLLQGEVGSGKTIVALRAMLTVVDSGGQAVLLAPTEVLAKQHYATITGLLGDLGDGQRLGAHEHATSVTLLTGSLPAAAKRQALNEITTGDAGIVIGTHALLSDPVEFFELGLVVIDEQHRFGVEQRAALAAKSAQQPHTLVMTATPIPRSVAMTVFGDLEVSELRERPAKRAAVTTVFVDTFNNPHWVERAWQRIREEVAKGRQAFIVCPAISAKQTEGDVDPATDMTAVTELLPRLASGPLADLRLGMAHGKQSVAERDEAMADFASGRIDVLVATTVIEVGVDVPNASVMVVMDADRFGITQLHQLRGRIGRGEHEGLCLLLAAPGEGQEDAQLRIRALVLSDDGFELAERDLELRKEGDVLGAAQSGGSSLKLLRVLEDADLIRATKDLADRVLADRRALNDPLLADLMTQAELVAAGEWLEKG
ncbi:ATP-dependent DNA helicase RecG [Tessaracoccus antarcticus]|uniref:Probable DNA 3'-5' helicase RecG n=1 Tax=Tessaracoccus antarcticus TaxID=2479848 RepID=A0A3M0GDX3_9ACTN|nr:ATP-dependent DNA helicase RecG [Tessaracoccus antarcticus]RMB59793.1 ATP-dependent DNA helicase RecG [Tessaracoccus antarcticus]